MKVKKTGRTEGAEGPYKGPSGAEGPYKGTILSSWER